MTIVACTILPYFNLLLPVTILFEALRYNCNYVNNYLCGILKINYFKEM